MSDKLSLALVYGIATAGVLSLALLACSHMEPRPARGTASANDVADSGPSPVDFTIYKGEAAIAKQVLNLVPTDYSSPLGRTFDEGHPIVIQPGDAFVLVDQIGDQLELQFNYPEVSVATVPVSFFPSGSLEFKQRSEDINDAATVDEDAGYDYSPTDIASGHGSRSKKNYHRGGTNCALTPHRAGCCLAAVKYKLIDMRLTKGIFAVKPKEYALYALKYLPNNFKSVGCEERKAPVRGTVCNYVSNLSPGEGHIEVFDGAGWYFGLGHTTLMNDGHHQCLDCKNPI